MDDIAAQLALRDSFRKKIQLQKTPTERLRDMNRLQEAMWQTLLRSPAGYAHFMRRNFKQRAIDVEKLPEH
jgi:hypothetical protein